MLYRGTGGNYWPYVPLLDKALGSAIARADVSGNRVGSVFASTSRAQAEEYVGDGGDLYIAEPLPGSTVTWAHGCIDLIVEFGEFLSVARYWARDRHMEAFLGDISGDVSIFEQYLSLRRQTRLTRILVDAFVREIDLREFRNDGRGDLSVALNGHEGEVWINGPCDLRPIPAPALQFA